MGSALGERATRVVGRHRELDLLGKSIEGTLDHRPCAWFVHGEPGVGKTRLLSEVCRQAEAAGATVLWGRCIHFGAASSPFGPLVGPIGEWLASADEPIRREFRTELDWLAGAAVGASEPGRMLRVLERLFARIASVTPLVLVVDDLQWADATSLDLLAYLVAGFSHQRMAVLVAFRGTELAEGHPLHGWLADLRRLPAVEDLALARLDETGTERQLAAITGRTPAARLVREVHGLSQGNPYLTELLVGDLPKDADSLPSGLPGELREVLLAGWHALRPRVREVVRLLAVGGRPLPYSTFAAVADLLGHDPAIVASALAEGARAGVLQVERGSGYWFRHPLLAEVLTSSLLPGEETAPHAAFVEVLSGVVPRDEAEEMRLTADLALHHEHSSRPDDAFALTLQAADHAFRLQGYPEQARHLLRAVELLHSVDPGVVAETAGGELELLERAAFACSRSGELGAAHQLVTRGLASVNRSRDPLRATRLLTEWCDLAWANQMVERPPLARLFEAVELSEVAPDSAEHATALARLAEAECACGLQEAGEQHASRAWEAAERSGSAAARAVALGARCVVNPQEPQALVDSKEACAWARRSGDPAVVADACTARVRCLESQGRVHEVIPVEAEGFAVSTATGARSYQAHFAGQAAMDSLRLGRFAEARAWVREGLAARSVGHGAVQARRAAAVLAIREGRLDEAGEHIGRILELSPGFEGDVTGFGAMLFTEYHLARGNPEEALSVVEHALADHAAGSPHAVDLLLLWGARAAGDLARSARDLADNGMRETARSRLRLLGVQRQSVAPGPFVPSGPLDLVAPAVRVLFEAESSRSDGSSGEVERWRAAVVACDAAGLCWEAASARRWLGVALLDEGAARAAAARALRGAYLMAREMGALSLLRDVETSARAARIALGEVDEPAVAGQDGSVLRRLTTREREVLSHLVAGRSYTEIAEALFISDKTVSVHVSNILRKTGARNRNEVSALGRRHGIVPEQ